MNASAPVNHPPRSAAAYAGAEPYQVFFFSELLKRPICAGKINQRLGRLTDLVFKIAEPYPEAVGIYVEHEYGRPSEFVAWDKVVKIEDDAVFVAPTEGGKPYPPFVDQPGWLMLNEHLMGRTILDMDGRRTEVVNDVHLLFSRGRMLLVHVDISFNGFLRRWGLKRLSRGKDRLISWRHVQPLSVEDVGATDVVSLSVTRKQIADLPGQDLADALETLSGKEQEAVFSALDSEKAAEVLVEAEPRARRQLVAGLRRERARKILSEMSVAQLADLFSVLPHDDMIEMMGLLPAESAARIQAILSSREATAKAIMSTDFLAAPRETKVVDILKESRSAGHSPASISYVYVVGENKLLLGVVDLRDLVLAADSATLAELMVSPVVSASEDDMREDLAEIFTKYHFRMIPVVDAQDHLLGVVRHQDIMQGLLPRAQS